MQYMYTMEYYSAKKKNEIMPFAATLMDLEIIILSEVSDRERQIPYRLHVESNKMIQINLQNRNRVPDIENKLWLPGGKGIGGINWETGIDICTLLYIK